MYKKEKITVLVIADINPRSKTDLRNVFILDYIRCIAPHCNVKVLSISLMADKYLTGKKGSKTEITNDGVEIKNFSITHKKPSKLLLPFYYLRWFYQSYQLGKKYKNIDIIHSHSAILHGSLSILLSKKLKAKLIFTEHTGPFSYVVRTPLRKFWARYVMQKADTILCVSNHLKNEILENNIIPKKTTVSYNPVSTDIFRLIETNPKEQYKNILYVGRLDDFKGGYRALLAFKKLAPQYHDWTMTIIGGGHDFKLIEQTVKNDTHLLNQVFLLGAQPKDIIAKEIQKTSFFLFPSNHESFGIVIAEAMSSGLPVIVGNRAAPKEIVNKNFGLIIDPDNIDEIAQATELMINTFKLYNSNEIRQHIVTNFGIDIFGKKMMKIYEDTLSIYP